MNYTVDKCHKIPNQSPLNLTHLCVNWNGKGNHMIRSEYLRDECPCTEPLKCEFIRVTKPSKPLSI